MNKTFIIFKPDALQRQLVESLKQEIQSAGFNIENEKSVNVTEALILKHYQEVIARVPIPDFKNRILKAFVGKEVICCILSSHHQDTVAAFRTLLGATNPPEADPQSLRGKYGVDSYDQSKKEERMLNNLIHASDSDENALKEIDLWFNQAL